MAGLLDGKSALITGGGGGIGRATALAFAREGARVAVADVSAEAASETVAQVNAAGGQAISLSGDVTRDADVRAMIEGVVGAYGRVDCAFNNAGLGLTKTAAIEYAEAHIRVNAVCPGYIKTPMTEETMRRRGEAILAQVPFHRMGNPEEIAELVVWLCSDRASYVSGAAYNVDGGWMAI